MTTCEPALRKYFAAFDGTKKDFSDVEDLFEVLYHPTFALTTADGKIVARDDVKEMHSGYLAMAPKVRLIHYRKIGLECVDVKFRVVAAGDVKVVRVIYSYSIEDGRLLKAQEISDSLVSVIKARCASDGHVWSRRCCSGCPHCQNNVACK